MAEDLQNLFYVNLRPSQDEHVQHSCNRDHDYGKIYILLGNMDLLEYQLNRMDYLDLFLRI